jgi:hypothetical protein
VAEERTEDCGLRTEDVFPVGAVLVSALRIQLAAR